MINYIVLDLDRTLLRDDSTVSEYTTSILQKCYQTGKTIIFATARPRIMAMDVIPICLTNYYLICSNGGEIYHGETLLYRNLLDETTCISAINIFKTKFPEVPFALVMGEQVFADRNMDSFFNTYFPNIKYNIGFDKIENLNYIDKILFELKAVKDISLIEQQLPQTCKVTKALGILGEIYTINATKYFALKHILCLLNASIEEVIAFGDDNADIEMIKYAKIGVAMGNSIAEVKSVANLITLDNNNEGVAKVLELYA